MSHIRIMKCTLYSSVIMYFYRLPNNAMDDFRVSLREGAANYCSLKTWRRRFPITLWLPNYKSSYILPDIIAGFTVGLTVIPQALAYASIAKLHIQVRQLQFYTMVSKKVMHVLSVSYFDANNMN